jgi:hypothetical protein
MSDAMPITDDERRQRIGAWALAGLYLGVIVGALGGLAWARSGSGAVGGALLGGVLGLGTGIAAGRRWADRVLTARLVLVLRIGEVVVAGAVVLLAVVALIVQPDSRSVGTFVVLAIVLGWFAGCIGRLRTATRAVGAHAPPLPSGRPT